MNNIPKHWLVLILGALYSLLLVLMTVSYFAGLYAIPVICGIILIVSAFGFYQVFTMNEG